MPTRDPPGEEPVERRDLHRGECDVAQRDGKEPDTDVETLGPGEGGRRGRDAALEEAVLPQPELVEAGLVGRARDRTEALGRELGAIHHTK